MVDAVELFEAKDDILKYINENIVVVLTILNRTERLDDFFQLIGMPNPFHKVRLFQTNKRGKIVVLGQSSISKADLLMIAGKIGFDKSRFEFHLGYEEMKKFNVRKYQYQFSYAAMLVGPMPHSGINKGDYSSIIARMEEDEGYPPVIRMGAQELKITKSGFQNVLKNLIAKGTIEKDGISMTSCTLLTGTSTGSEMKE